MKKHLLRIIALISIVLAGCNTNAGTVDISINETSADITEVTDEVVHMNNCGGKGEVSQTAERSKSVNVEFTGSVSNTLGTEIASINREVSAKYGEVNSSTKKIELVAPAGTNMEFSLKWTEKTWLGIVLVQGKDEQGKYKVSVPISVDLVSSRDLGCGSNSSSISPTSSSPSETTDVSISAKQGWQSTQVNVQKGTDLTIEVIGGKWTSWMDQKPYNQGVGWGYICAPDNSSSSGCVEPLPNFSQGGLIGKVGNQVFGVGSGITITAQETGTIYLRINDGDDGLYDNDGELNVRISVSR